MNSEELLNSSDFLKKMAMLTCVCVYLCVCTLSLSCILNIVFFHISGVTSPQRQEMSVKMLAVKPIL